MSFELYSGYYDLLYGDKDYAVEADYVSKHLIAELTTTADILEFGSGTGRHARALTDFGHNVHGVELSASMVEASNIVDGFTCQQGDMTTVRLERTYDAVIALFHVLSYQITNYQLQSTFANAARHLNIGGLFIFDFWYSPAVYAQRPSVRIKRASDQNILLTRIAEPVVFPNESRVDVHYEFFVQKKSSAVITSFKETHCMRHFSLRELDFLATNNGFERITTEELISGRAPSEETWGVCTVMKKVQ